VFRVLYSLYNIIAYIFILSKELTALIKVFDVNLLILEFITWLIIFNIDFIKALVIKGLGLYFIRFV
jgi:hypothetical protein